MKGNSDKCPREADHPMSYGAMPPPPPRKIFILGPGKADFQRFHRKMEGSFMPLKQSLF